MNNSHDPWLFFIRFPGNQYKLCVDRLIRVRLQRLLMILLGMNACLNGGLAQDEDLHDYDDMTRLSLRAMPVEENQVLFSRIDSAPTTSPDLFIEQGPLSKTFFLERRNDLFGTGDTLLYNPLSDYTYEPPTIIAPVKPKTGISNFTIKPGLYQTYDSNVLVTPVNKIADFYDTLQLQVTHQLGTPDSPYVSEYETICALETSAEFSHDFFWRHSEFDVSDTQFSSKARIGRDAFILRPFIEYTDLTSASLLVYNGIGRIQRIQSTAGMIGDERISANFSLHQEASMTNLNHPDPTYIDLNTLRLENDPELRLNDALTLLGWNEYRQGSPSRGALGEEVIMGLGWKLELSQRLYSELKVGWGNLTLQNGIGNRVNESGFRLQGSTTYAYNPYLEWSFKYFREYSYNEIDVNDNDLTSGVQDSVRLNFAGNWSITDFFGMNVLEFEASRREILDYHPDVELAYNFKSDSKIFAKCGYDYSEQTKGPGLPIDELTITWGINYAF